MVLSCTGGYARSLSQGFEDNLFAQFSQEARFKSRRVLSVHEVECNTKNAYARTGRVWGHTLFGTLVRGLNFNPLNTEVILFMTVY